MQTNSTFFRRNNQLNLTLFQRKVLYLTVKHTNFFVKFSNATEGINVNSFNGTHLRIYFVLFVNAVNKDH
jgi:hypothetical protein